LYRNCLGIVRFSSHWISIRIFSQRYRKRPCSGSMRLCQTVLFMEERGIRALSLKAQRGRQGNPLGKIL
jgi:hypothetical protein